MVAAGLPVTRDAKHEKLSRVIKQCDAHSPSKSLVLSGQNSCLRESANNP